MRTRAEYEPAGYAADARTMDVAPVLSVPVTTRSNPSVVDTVTSYLSATLLLGTAAPSAIVHTAVPSGTKTDGFHVHVPVGARAENESAVYGTVMIVPVLTTRNVSGPHAGSEALSSPLTWNERTPSFTEYVAPATAYGTTGPLTTEMSASVPAPVDATHAGAGLSDTRAAVFVSSDASTKLNPVLVVAALGSRSDAVVGTTTHGTVAVIVELSVPIVIAITNAACVAPAGTVNDVGVTTIASAVRVVVNSTTVGVPVPKVTPVTTRSAFVVGIVNVTFGPS